jgi:putative exosortase-associated protein (TIGR04073 family)
MSYSKAAFDGVLSAEAREVTRNSKLVTYDVKVMDDKGIVVAVFQGIGYFLAREGVGIVDIVTFPMPLPGCPDDPNDIGWGYGPIMEPEWIFTREQNPYNFFYHDQSLSNY